ncbi:hypothetical protein [Streptomyces sulphureus]|uniref:hypothetical protein n=1 Tax=Streptomyces sulphureus TaxID=47758 RepID=UPI001FDF6019|nr:hypothetical protein [Streptomyces sulphureus]
MAGHCTTEPDGQLSLSATVFSRDGSKFTRAHIWGDTFNEAGTLGFRVCAEPLRQDARDVIDGIPH